MKEKCICPVCGKEYNTLLRHIRIHNPEIHNKEDFYKIFPEYKGLLHIDKREKHSCPCEICGKVYDYQNSLALHYKKIHGIVKQETRKNAKLICPICGKNYSDIKQHIEGKHLISWENFCNTYNWNKTLTKYISDEYRKKLSKNKIEFYKNTERGKELKELNSELWKTERNPSKNKNSKSKSIYSRATNGNWISENNYRGIKVIYNNKTFRSFNEFQFYILCIYFGKSIEYEPHEFVVQYYNEEKMFLTTYLPDFYIDNQIIELKALPHDVNIANKSEKYNKVKTIYKNKQIKFSICTIRDALSLLGISCENYQIKDITKDIIKDAIKKDEIHIICKSYSRTIKYYFGLDDLSNNKNITLI